VLLEAVVGNASSLFEAGHSFADFDADVAVDDHVKKVALIDDLLQNELD
jgi:hypothetical protein